MKTDSFFIELIQCVFWAFVTVGLVVGRIIALGALGMVINDLITYLIGAL